MKKKIIITLCTAVPVVALAAFLRSRRKRYAVGR